MSIEITSDNVINTLNNNKITILQFSAEWCGPCKMLTPVMVKLSEINANKDVVIGKLISIYSQIWVLNIVLEIYQHLYFLKMVLRLKEWELNPTGVTR
jgi:thiol-disulfide isomerase/thioredoxin